MRSALTPRWKDMSRLWQRLARLPAAGRLLGPVSHCPAAAELAPGAEKVERSHEQIAAEGLTWAATNSRLIGCLQKPNPVGMLSISLVSFSYK